MVGNLTVSDEGDDGTATITTYAETKYSALVILDIMIQESPQLLENFASDAVANGYTGNATLLSQIKIETYSAMTLEPTAFYSSTNDPSFCTPPWRHLSPTEAPTATPSWHPTFTTTLAQPNSYRHIPTDYICLPTFGNVSSQTFQSSSILQTTLQQILDIAEVSVVTLVI